MVSTSVENAANEQALFLFVAAPMLARRWCQRAYPIYAKCLFSDFETGSRPHIDSLLRHSVGPVPFAMGVFRLANRHLPVFTSNLLRMIAANRSLGFTS